LRGYRAGLNLGWFLGLFLITWPIGIAAASTLITILKRRIEAFPLVLFTAGMLVLCKVLILFRMDIMGWQFMLIRVLLSHGIVPWVGLRGWHEIC
jgi:hypothetical protein